MDEELEVTFHTDNKTGHTISSDIPGLANFLREQGFHLEEWDPENNYSFWSTDGGLYAAVCGPALQGTWAQTNLRVLDEFVRWEEHYKKDRELVERVLALDANKRRTRQEKGD